MEKTRVSESKKITGNKSGKEMILKILTSTEEAFFIEKLGENSEDFLYLKKLVKEIKQVTWKKLIDTVNIVDMEIEGIYWEDELMLSGTNIKNLGKFKEIRILHMNGTDIEDLGELEKVDILYVKGSKLKTIGKVKEIGEMFRGEGADIELQLEVIEKVNSGELKLGHGDFGGDVIGIEKLKKIKVIPGNLILRGVQMEDLGEIEEINGYFVAPKGCKKMRNLKKIGLKIDLSNTLIDLQLLIIKKINAGILKVEGGLEFGGNIEGIENFLEVGHIPGGFDMHGLSLEMKLKFIDKINRGELSIEGVYCDVIDCNLGISGEPGHLPSCTNGYFPRIGLDTNLEDESIKFWEKSISNIRDIWDDGEREYLLVEEWMGNKMKEYYLESIKNYKVNCEAREGALGCKVNCEAREGALVYQGDNFKKLKKEKDNFFKKYFPDLFPDNIVSMEKYKNR